MKLKSAFAFIGLSTIIASCATSPYVPTLYDPEVAQVKSIAIAEDAIQEKLSTHDMSTNSGTGQAAGGLIGLALVSAIEGGQESGRTRRLNELMESTGFDGEAEFESMLMQKLKAAGFSNVTIAGGERTSRVPLKEYPATSADAVLDVNITNFGIQRPNGRAEWRPASGVDVKLVSTSDQSVLMENIISYNAGKLNFNKEGIIVLTPPQDGYSFRVIKDADADAVLAEMRTMLDEVTTAIVSLVQ